MNNLYWYLNAAMHASIEQGEPLVDESLSLILDSAFRFSLRVRDDDIDAAESAGERRVNDPTNPLND